MAVRGWTLPKPQAAPARPSPRAIKVLEDTGVLSWIQRIKRVRVRCPDLFGADGVRVVPQRTSNAYHFNDPGGAGAASNLNKKIASAPKSEKPTGTANQAFFSSLEVACGDERTGLTAGKRLGEEGGGVARLKCHRNRIGVQTGAGGLAGPSKRTSFTTPIGDDVMAGWGC